MGDIKPVSFRINDEDQEKFKKFATDNGFSQAEAFASILGMLELDKARASLGERAKSIDAFRDTATRLVNFYINSLEENATAEEQIRDKLAKEMKAKDDSISTLAEELNKAKEKIKVMNKEMKVLDDKNGDLILQLNKYEIDNIDKQKTIDKLTSSNDLLQDNLKEYKSYQETNKVLEKKIDNYKNEALEADKKYRELMNFNKQLQDKDKNNEEMLAFYKENNKELKDNNLSLEHEIKDITIKNENYLEKIKAEYNQTLSEKLKDLKNNMNTFHKVELQQKDLEIERLKEENKTLKTKKQKKSVKSGK